MTQRCARPPRPLRLRLAAAVALAPAICAGALPSAATQASVPTADGLHANPTASTLQPARLKRGPDAGIDYLQDGVLHASGKSIPVRLGRDVRGVQLLGRSAEGGWLVAYRTRKKVQVVTVRRNQPPAAVPKTLGKLFGPSDVGIGYKASEDGTWVMTTAFDRGGSSTMIRDLAGKRHGNIYSSSFFRPFTADAGHVYTLADIGTTPGSVVDWVPGEGKTVVAENGNFVSPRDDVLFTKYARRAYGPTSLSAPGTPAWGASFLPYDVSPERGYVLGTSHSRKNVVLEVRRMDDGTMLQALDIGDQIDRQDWTLGDTDEQTARFESESSFVFQLTRRGRAVLVRCTLTGACERASDTGGDISFAGEDFIWW